MPSLIKSALVVITVIIGVLMIDALVDLSFWLIGE